MKLLEYEAKMVFKKYGIPTPEGYVVTSANEAKEKADQIGLPVVVKAQLPVGGRGKAGGIVFADSSLQVFEVANELLGKKVQDLVISKLLIEEKIVILKEIYLGVTVDRKSKQYVILASSEGGVEIEEVAKETPEKIVRHQVDPLLGLKRYHSNLVAKRLGFSGTKMSQFSSLLLKLYKLAVDMDAELTEINPLAEVEDGFIAADARLNVDNNALFRHKELEKKIIESYQGELTQREIEARKKGLTYVELDGDIGVIGNGAGLTMATLDTVMLHKGKAANFLDLGGGASADRIERAVEFVLNDDRTKTVLVNVLGGITRGDDVARGIVRAHDKLKTKKPIVVRLMGTNEKEGQRILREAGIMTLDTMEEVANHAVLLTGGE
jgi:succinyl-CoA synthetase beta subunit